MMGQRWGGYRNFSTNGYPYTPADKLNLGSTPLNSAIVMAMDIIPAFQKASGVQKIHTVFLTDGASDKINERYHVYKDNNGEVRNGLCGISAWGWNSEVSVFSDPKTGAKVTSSDYSKGHGETQTKMLLALLKKRVPDMNVVNFFVAGSGRGGKISKYFWNEFSFNWREQDQMKKDMKTNNCVVIPDGQGFDSLYVLPGLNKLEMDTELDVEVGANKGALKRAFGKMTKGKMSSRPVLNNFIKMVA